MAMDGEDPYFVEVDNNGCPKCGHERTYTIIQPGGDAIGKSFSDEDDASELAELLNEAYYRGRRGEHEAGRD